MFVFVCFVQPKVPVWYVLAFRRPCDELQQYKSISKIGQKKHGDLSRLIDLSHA